jgi:hypothetical protein
MPDPFAPKGINPHQRIADPQLPLKVEVANGLRRYMAPFADREESNRNTSKPTPATDKTYTSSGAEPTSPVAA